MFYVGIIGECSCGKSEFVTAFIEHQYLFEDILQELTCANTIIRYGIEENVIVEYNNGKVKKFNTAFTKIVSGLQSALGAFIPMFKKKEDKNQKREQMREMLRAATAVEENAQNISSVTLVSPFEVLKDGFVIVDTPGIGSTNPRHTEVARRGAADCDALLVLTNLQATVLSKDLIVAVRDIAGSSAENCIFVGTHLDLLPPKERKRMEAYFEKKLSSTFGRYCPHYMVSGESALKELETGTQPAEDTGIGLEAFRSFRGEIKEHLKRNRQHIQAKKVTLLIAELIKNLDTALTERQQTFTQQREQFQQMVIPENSDFWDTWLNRMKRQFDESSQEIEHNSQIVLDTIILNMQNEIIQAIRSYDDSDELKSYLKNGVKNTIEKYDKKIATYCSVNIEKALNNAAEAERSQFVKECETNCHELAAICGSKTQIQQGKSRDITPLLITSSGLQGFHAVADKIEASDNSNIYNGLITGIKLSVMLPGVGWLAGSLITVAGGVLGFLWNSVEKQQEQAIQDITKAIAVPRSELPKNLSVFYQQVNSSAKLYFDRKLSEQKDFYASAVKGYTEDLENTAETIAGTVSYINTQKVVLSQIANQVCAIQADAAQQKQ